MSRESDFGYFCAARDEETSQTYATTSVSTGFTLVAEGLEVTVGSTSGFSEGENVVLTEASKPTAYAVVTAVRDGTHLSIRPMRSEADGAGAIGTAYTTSATLATTGRTHLTMVIDLTEAPAGSYRYLIVGSASYRGDTVNAGALAVLKTAALLGDHAGGTNRGIASFKVKNTSGIAQIRPYNAACSVTLEAGQRYEFRLQHQATITAGAKCYMSHGRLYALRFSKIYEAGDGTGAGTTTTSSSDQVDTGLQVTLPAAGGGTYYLLVATRVVNNNTGGGTVRSTVSGAAISALASQTQIVATAPGDTGDDISLGHLAIVSQATAGGVANLQLAAPAGGTARHRYGYLALIPLEDFTSGIYNSDFSTSAAASSTRSAETFGEVAAGATPPRSGFELTGASIVASKGGNGQWAARFRASHAQDEIQLGFFWFARSKYGIGNLRNAQTAAQGFIEARSTNGTANAVTLQSDVPSFSFMELRPRDEVDSDESTIVAEIEAPLAIKKWTLVSGTLYKATPEGLEFGARARVNRSEYTQVFDRPTADLQWYWNPEPASDGAIDTTVSGSHNQPTIAVNSVTVTLASGTNVRIGRRVVVTSSGSSYHARVIAGSGTSWTLEWLREAGDTPGGTAYATGATVKATEGSTLFVQFPSGTVPTDANKVAVVVEKIHLSRQMKGPVVLRDVRNVPIPYKGRLLDVPSIDESMDVTASGPQASRSFGAVVIANADGELDRLIGKRLVAGARAVVRRGSVDVSNKVGDFETLAIARLGSPRYTPEQISIPMLDRFSVLSMQVTPAAIAAYEGTAGQYRLGQTLPVIYGTALRVPGYRITNQTGGSDDNYFRVSAANLKAVDAAYKDASTLSTITATLHDGPRGLVKVNNAQTSNVPQDVVYFDVQGVTSDGTTAGALLSMPGEIAEHFLTNYPRTLDTQLGTSTTTSASHTPVGGATASLSVGTAPALGARVRVTSGSNSYVGQVVATGSGTCTVLALRESGDVYDVAYGSGATVQEVSPGAAALATSELDRASFRLLDRVWRRQIKDNQLSFKPLTIAAIIDGASTVRDAVTQHLASCFGYLRINRQDRAQVDVPDMDARNLTENPGLENSSGSIYPFRSVSPAASLISGSAYEGRYAAVFSCSRNSQAALRQEVVFAKPGLHLATALLKLSDGSTQSASLGIVGPHDGQTEALGDPVTLSSSEWRRASCVIDVAPGAAGTALVSVYPCRESYSEPPQTNLSHWYAFGYDIQFPADYATWSPITNRGSAGSGGNLTQSTAGRYPLPKDDVVGGQRVARFDGSNDAWSLSTAPSIGNLGQAHTLWAVFKMASVSGTQYLFGYDTGNYLRYNAASTRFEYADAGQAQVTWTRSLTAGNWYAACAKRANDGTVTLYLYDAGTLLDSGSLSVWNGALSWSTVGALNSSGSSSFNGDIAEVLVYSATQSDADFALTLGYLRAKYGLQEATVLADNIRAVPIAAILDDVNTEVESIDEHPLVASVVRARFGVPWAAPERSRYRGVTGNEARGILPLAFSESEQSLDGPSVYDLSESLFDDSPSAAGAGASAVAYLDRVRQRGVFAVYGLPKTPQVGEMVYVTSSRVPPRADGYALWRVVGVELQSNFGRACRIVAERQIDPIIDRVKA